MHMSVFNERKMTRMAFREAKTLAGLDGDFPTSTALSLLRFTGILEKDKVYFCNEMARELEALELPYPARVAACQRVAAVTNIAGPAVHPFPHAAAGAETVSTPRRQPRRARAVPPRRRWPSSAIAWHIPTRCPPAWSS